MPHLFLKDDTRNPSGSTKDRASLLVVAKAIEYGCDTVATASTGNAASALAAVAASAGLRAVVLVPATAPPAKLVQMQSYGADRRAGRRHLRPGLRSLHLEPATDFGWYNRSTALNPFTIEGKKTAALEIAAAMAPESPDAVLVPTGDGVILAGLAKGFRDLENAGLIDRRPRLIAVQPEGSSAIATAAAIRGGRGRPLCPARPASPTASPSRCRATPLAVWPKSARQAEAAVTVSDDAISAAISRLAKLDRGLCRARRRRRPGRSRRRPRRGSGRSGRAGRADDHRQRTQGRRRSRRSRGDAGGHRTDAGSR